MKSIKSLFLSRALLTVLLLGAWAMAPVATVSAQQPTSEQLQVFQNLPPDQQEAALKLMMERNLKGGQTTQQAPADEPEQEQIVQPREVQDEALDQLDIVRRTDLKPYGYDLFAGEPTTFTPATDIPVPVDYVVGPGDTVKVQLFGKTNADYSLVVNREGMLNFPELGPVSVAGLGFQQMKDDLERRIDEQMIGVSASITMGSLRSIRIFVLGDAYKPGSYTVSSLSTMTNALFVSGGVKPIGSLRNIQLKRKGRVVARLDLYDLLLKGDTRNDARLMPGDVIFVPPVGDVVGVAGEVKRPAVYELRNERTVSDLLVLAGGVLPSAYPKEAKIQRIGSDYERILLDIDLNSAEGVNLRLRPDDILRVASVLSDFEDSVILSGHVFRPGRYEWRPGMRLSALIPSLDQLRPQADLDYVLIRRESQPNGEISVLSTSVRNALAAAGGESDLSLEENDHVIAFGLSEDRGVVLEPILDELRMQSSKNKPAKILHVRGNVRSPGDYPLEDEMTVSDLLRAAGGLSESAYSDDAELTRYRVSAGNLRETQRIVVDLAGILQGNSGADLPLVSRDYLFIKEIPEWQDREEVTLEGEVRFPGTFALAPGDTLVDVLDRAGGITERAFLEGAVFTRESVRSREKAQFEKLAGELESDLATAALGQSQSLDGRENSAEALAIGESLLQKLREMEPSGRVVIDLPSIVEGAANADLELQDGDTLLVPRFAQEVTVIGEVQNPTSHLYQPDKFRNEYIAMSGGETYRADRKRIYVVRANGSVAGIGRSKWFGTGGLQIEPGDTIVVPLDATRMRPLTRLSAISQILYQFALAAASAKAVGAF